ncbi:hypothetical protein ACJOT3_28240, partial [Nocardiopsis sp. frass1]
MARGAFADHDAAGRRSLYPPGRRGEAVVHGGDIRRPPGIAGDRPVDTLTRAAEYYRGPDQA